jgi:hypothetical protein
MTQYRIIIKEDSGDVAYVTEVGSKDEPITRPGLVHGPILEASSEQVARDQWEIWHFVTNLARDIGYSVDDKDMRRQNTFSQLYQILTDKTGARQKRLIRMLEYYHQQDQTEVIIDGTSGGRSHNPRLSLKKE